MMRVGLKQASLELVEFASVRVDRGAVRGLLVFQLPDWPAVPGAGSGYG
jgi:hypothetical protein